ncbi:MAG: diaminopimelate decarboxylase [Kiritimatiellia bacterium]|nr:diaminopimelate decarboxylase [Kiritimatiellia bacterium]
MNVFIERDGELHAEGIPVSALAEEYGTPLYIYSRGHLLSQYRALAQALAPLSPTLCFAIKSNSCGAVIATLGQAGAGADVVSGGELFRARRAGIPADRIVFAGVGKTIDEIDSALQAGIRFFTVESEAELKRISDRATHTACVGRVALRVNPDVDPQTHKYTSTGKKENKFGVDLERAERAMDWAASLPSIEISGLHMHLGSPIADVAPFAEALEKVAPLCRKLAARFPSFQTLDIGGGLGIPYRPGEAEFNLDRFASVLIPPLKALGLRIVLEPGRFLTGNAGILVKQIQYVKKSGSKVFLIGDAGMNDLIRPPLYQAWHTIQAVRPTSQTVQGDLVGPICESGDFLAQDRELPDAQPGDYLAVMSAGAYGMAMASNYNSRGRAAEVLIDGTRHTLVRERETMEDLVRGERIPDWV